VIDLAKGEAMVVSKKMSKISTVVAVLCILIYIAAIAFGAFRIIVNFGERRNLAESEFYDLSDKASSAAVSLGFMSEAYQETIRDSLGISYALMGVIITGTSGEFAFERYPGSGIVWAGNSPRFKTGAGFSGEPFFLPLRIDGQRNVTIQAIYSLFDYNLFQRVFRDTLLAVLAALAIALITLLVEVNKKKKTYKGIIPEMPLMKERPAAEKPASRKSTEDEESPLGLYSPRGNIGWESYTNDRLASELHRCASFEQDLTVLAMEFKVSEILSDDEYCLFTEEAVNYFTMRDLIFGKGDNGIIVLLPGTDLEHGISKSEEFNNLVISKMPEFFRGRTELRIGLSSRSGRLMDAERLMFEAIAALKKAFEDPVSHVVAFKSDPEKYREFIKEQHRKNSG
jgi:hypothetical protein